MNMLILGLPCSLIDLAFSLLDIVDHHFRDGRLSKCLVLKSGYVEAVLVFFCHWPFGLSIW